MSELRAMLDISSRTIGTDAVQTVNARDLHAFLEIGRDFSNWIKGRIEQYGFADGLDYVTAENLSTPNLASAKSRAQVVIDYHLSIDMAKELAMVERNDKGKQARQYFIECERRAKAAPAALIPQSLPEALRLAADLAEKKAQAEAALAIAAPKAEALDLIAAGEESITITEAAKMLGIKRDTLTKWMHVNGWVYRLNGAWVAKQAHLQNRDLDYKEGFYPRPETGEMCCKPYCHIMPKGLTKLAKVFSVKEAA